MKKIFTVLTFALALALGGGMASAQDHGINKPTNSTNRPSGGTNTNRTSYLRVNNSTSPSASFSASGGTQTFSVSSSSGSYTITDVPDWITVTNKASKSFTIRCSSNSYAARSSYFTVKSGSRSVRVTVRQSAGNNSNTGSVTASINSVSIRTDVTRGGTKGLEVTTGFTVRNSSNRDITLKAFFYDPNGDFIQTDDGLLNWGEVFRCTGNPCTMTKTVFIPYYIFPYSSSFSGTLSLDMNVFDYEDDLICESSKYSFRVSSGTFQGTAQNNGSPSATINSVNIRPDVTRGGERGIEVTTNFTVNNENGNEIDLHAFFYGSDGNSHRDSSDSWVQWTEDYRVSGNPCTMTKTQFIPYSHIGRPTQFSGNTMYLDMNIFSSSGDLICESQKYKFTVPSGVFGSAGAANNGAPSASITSVTSQNVTRGGVQGLEITAKFTVRNENGNRIRLTAFFYDGNGEKLYDSDGDWFSHGEGFNVSGNPATMTKSIFIPFSDMNRRSGWTGTLQYDMNVFGSNGDLLTETSKYRFTFPGTGGGGNYAPGASIDNVTMNHNVYKNGVKGMEIVCKFSVKGCSGQTCRLVAYFYDSDKTSWLYDSDGDWFAVREPVSVSSNNQTFTRTLFVPYRDINKHNGWNGTLYFDVNVFSQDSDLLVETSKYSFTYTAPR